MKLITIFLFIFNSAVASATVELDILEGKISPQPSLRSAEYCASCNSIQAQLVETCPKYIEYIIDQTLSSTIYNALIGKKLLDACTGVSLKNVSSPEKLDANISSMLNHEFNVSQAGITSCLQGQKINFQKINLTAVGTQKVVTGYLHTLHRSILDKQGEQLEQLAALDQLLGKKPLDNFKCDSHFEKKCADLRACPSATSAEEVADYSMEVLEQTSALIESRNALARKVRLQEITLEDYKKEIAKINTAIDTLKQMAPWFSGEYLTSFYNNYYATMNDHKKAMAKKEFERLFKKQAAKTREAVHGKMMETSLAYNCLKNDHGCTTKVMEEMNAFVTGEYSKAQIDMSKYDGKDEKSRNAFAEALEANNYLGQGSCVANLLKGKKVVDEAAMLVATTGVGLLTGGVGGVLRLGQLALRATQAGSRLKAAGSIGLLSAETKIAYDSVQMVANECAKAVNTIQEVDSGNGCSKSGANTFKISNLKPCIISTALTAAPALFAMKTHKTASMRAEEAEIEKALVESQQYFKTQIKNPLLSEVEKADLSRSLARLNLTKSEAEEVLTKLNAVIQTEKDKNRLKNYVNFVLSLRPDEQKIAIKALHDAVRLSGDFNPGGYVEKFYLKENKFYLYEKMKTDSLKKKFIKEGKTEQLAMKEAESMARASRGELQRKYYSCQAKTLTPEIKMAAKKYGAFSIALGVGGATYGFAKNNTELYEENKTQFFGKLSYDIVMAYFLSKLSAEIMKSPEGTFLQRYAASNVGAAKLSLIDATVYSSLYGGSEAEARKKVEEIMHSTDMQNELLILDNFINSKGLVEKFKNSIVDNYKKVLSSSNKEEALGAGPYEIGDFKFSNLTQEELEKSEVKEKLVKAVIKKMNSGDSGALLLLGDKGADRWVNDRVWNAAIGVPKGIAVGVLISQVLCLGADSPIASLGIATGIQFTNQFLSGDAYYKFRKEFIGQ